MQNKRNPPFLAGFLYRQIQLTINMDDNAKSAGVLHKALDKLGTAAKAFIGVYGAKKLWEVLIGSNEEMEQYQTSFEVMFLKINPLISDIL